MSEFIFSIFLTLVVFDSACFAAAEVQGEMKGYNYDSSRIQKSFSAAKEHQLGFDIYGGMAFGVETDSSQTLATWLLGISHPLTIQNENFYLNIDLMPDEKIIGLALAKKFAIFGVADYSTYYKLALGTHFQSGDNVGNLVQYSRWQAQASYGIEDIKNADENFFGELFAAYSSNGLAYGLIGGFHF